jgi:prolyl oligopeptidase
MRLIPSLIRYALNVAVLSLSGELFAQAMPPPQTPRYRVTNNYFGRPVSDDYRWLEQVDSAAVRGWVESQNSHSNRYFGSNRHLPMLEKRIDSLHESAPVQFRDLQSAEGVVCVLCDESLVVLDAFNKAEPLRTLVDVETYYPDRECTIDEFVLSHNGRLVAVSASPEGTGQGTVLVFDTQTGDRQSDEISGAYTPTGGSLAWRADDKGFYYTRHPYFSPTEKRNPYSYACQEIWYHQLGTSPASDAYICGRDFPRYAGCNVVTHRHSQQVIINSCTAFGAQGQSFFLWSPTAGMRQIAAPANRIACVDFGPRSTLLLESCHQAPRGQLLKMPLNNANLERATVLVPQSEGVLLSFTATENLVYVVDRLDGSDRLRVFAMDGTEKPSVDVPEFTGIMEVVPLAGDQIVYRATSFLRPSAWFRYDPAANKSERTALSEDWPVSFEDAEVVREEVVSRDGAKVPLMVIRPRDIALDGERPTLLRGYGGYKLHEQPDFEVERRVWLDLGGVYAIAHPRGEGELGEDWYLPAMHGKKQVTCDDFVACAEHLVTRRYTTASRLAIAGASHGGLLIGMALTQRPQLFAAALCDCGALDLLRLEQEPLGLFLVSDDGTVSDPAQFRAMLAASPFHRVRDSLEYPAVWLRAGENDHVVSPWHSWKMAAKLQSSGTKKPVLLTAYRNTGHDFASSAAKEFAFLFDQLRIEESAPAE